MKCEWHRVYIWDARVNKRLWEFPKFYMRVFAAVEFLIVLPKITQTILLLFCFCSFHFPKLISNNIHSDINDFFRFYELGLFVYYCFLYNFVNNKIKIMSRYINFFFLYDRNSNLNSYTNIWRPRRLNLHPHRGVRLFGKGDYHWAKYPSGTLHQLQIFFYR